MLQDRRINDFKRLGPKPRWGNHTLLPVEIIIWKMGVRLKGGGWRKKTVPDF